MATWAEVQERVRARFQLDRDEPHEFTLTVPRQADGARAQRVMVHHFEAWGKEMVEYRSAFGELGETEPVSLLEESLKLPMGAVALHGRFMVVVHKECLEHITVEGVLYTLTRISLLADVLEERRGGDRF